MATGIQMLFLLRETVHYDVTCVTSTRSQCIVMVPEWHHFIRVVPTALENIILCLLSTVSVRRLRDACDAIMHLLFLSLQTGRQI